MLKIISHYGVIIIINKNGMMFSIIPSKLDSGKVNGLFGNYNGDPNDDFQIKRNGNSASSQDDFFNSFK